MDFKKYGIIYLLVLVVVALFGVNYLLPGLKFNSGLNNNFKIKYQNASPQTTGITVTINDGETIRTFKNLPAKNAYEGLVSVSKQADLELKTKDYSFGVFIEEIGGQKNTDEKAWIYYINGKAGDVASDKKAVSDGDIVEWKYEKPTY